MNEHTARDIVLVRAIETTDRQREILSDEDRLYASRSARELAQWHAISTKSAPATEHFLQQRAEQVQKRIAERYPVFAGFARPRSGMRVLAFVLPIIALLSGAVVDRIGDVHRVDLLSAPLLLIVGWNLLTYIALLVGWIRPSSGQEAVTAGLLHRFGAGIAAVPRKLPHVLSIALLTFVEEWTRLSRKLNLARLRRTMHLSAALFALGAMVSLYVRGMLQQYVAGWESTFLNAAQVQAILSFVFAPALAVFPLQGFTVAEIEALRFSEFPSPSGGARWVHLYGATLLLLVVLPRLLLAAMAQFQARRLAHNFPLDLEQPYFRHLQQILGAVPGVLRVLPYSFTIDEARDRGLNAIAGMLLGEHARLMLRPPIAYGEEPHAALAGETLNDPAVTTTAVLFNLAATPEKENHGALLQYMVHKSTRGFAVLLDESGLRERTGAQAGGDARVNERIVLWQEFCNFHHVPATVVNLLHPELHPINSDAGLRTSAAA